MVQAQFPQEQSDEGAFTRQPDAFRDWVTADDSSGYPAAKGRYHLYVLWACPWAHRTIIVQKLKRLEDVIGMTVVDPIRDEQNWRGSPTFISSCVPAPTWRCSMRSAT
jgi:glutathionyl-hydroquinone reductase